MSSPRFLVDGSDLGRADLELRGEELRHLRARRLRPGSEVVLTDGAGREGKGIIVKIARDHAEVRLRQSEVRPSGLSESPLRLELAQAALKADKLDFVIEKATELGVSDLVIFTSLRCVSRPPATRAERWQRIARSAAKQCQRSNVPSIRGPVPFDEILRNPASPLRLLFWEGAGPQSRLEAGPGVTPKRDVLAVVGPEGGFDPNEVEAARAAGFRAVGLGPRILRAETAAIVAVTLCQRLWGDL